jgi:hypothetical protein
MEDGVMNSLPNVDRAQIAGENLPHRADTAPEDIRIPSVGEHLLRILGFKRNESLYGVDGDRIAAQHPEKGDNGFRGYEEQVPIFILHGRHNEMVAYFILCAIVSVVSLTVALAVGRIGTNSDDTTPTSAVSSTGNTSSPATPFGVSQEQPPPTVRYTMPNQNSKGPQGPRMQICTPR